MESTFKVRKISYWANNPLKTQGSHFLTISHDLHRARRKPLEPYFSKLGITQFEPVIHHLAESFAYKFHKLENTNVVVRLDHAMVCYTGDMISHVCCEDPTSLLDDENFSVDWWVLNLLQIPQTYDLRYESLHTIIKSMPLFEGFPWILRLVRYIPKSILLWVDPRSQLFNDWKDVSGIPSTPCLHAETLNRWPRHTF